MCGAMQIICFFGGVILIKEAMKAGKDIGLANKETLIAGGPVVAPTTQSIKATRQTP